LICNLQNIFEKKKQFLNWKSASGQIRRSPARASRRIGCEELMATQRQIGSKHPSRDADSIGLIRVIDPVANGPCLIKFVDP
jgi:hypothetical protein